MLNILFLLLGILFCSIGLFFIILYCNLLTIGYSFFEFVNFIIRSAYCDLFFIGVIFIVCVIERIKK